MNEKFRMSDTKEDQAKEYLPKVGRRTFMWGAALAAAAPIMSEGSLAYAARASFLGEVPPDAVLINATQNPLVPSKAACQAIADIAPAGGRYDKWDEGEKFTNKYAELHGLKPENIAVYAGSSEPLHYAVLAFTSPTRGLVVAGPSYESPMGAGPGARAPIHKVHLTSDYAHDIKAMVAADPNAGV